MDCLFIPPRRRLLYFTSLLQMRIDFYKKKNFLCGKLDQKRCQNFHVSFIKYHYNLKSGML
jgi:hypothetical protein